MSVSVKRPGVGLTSGKRRSIFGDLDPNATRTAVKVFPTQCEETGSAGSISSKTGPKRQESNYFVKQLEEHRKTNKISEAKRKQIEAEIELTRKRCEEIFQTVDYKLNPDTTPVRRFNVLLLAVIIGCTFWTPYEVAFLDLRLDLLFMLNRVVDAIFFSEFVMKCFTIYKDQITGKTERSQWKIIKRYSQGRMLLDLALSLGSTICDSLVLLNPNWVVLELCRLLRLSHLTKLKRLVGECFIYFNIMEGDFVLTYNQLSLIKFVAVIVSLVHWMACTWRLVVKFEFQNNNWILVEGLAHEEPGELYMVCLYWASTTITTIGYGDVANATNYFERGVAVLCMLLGALVWAYIIGGVTAVVSAFNLDELEFSEQMDRLNQYMETKHMPLDLRERLRAYFRHRRNMEKDSAYAHLLEKMSPTLRGEVARSVSREWLKRVPWLCNGSLGFIASVAIALESELYAPKEIIMGAQLRVLTRGVVAKNARIYTRGSVWGVDMILSSESLKNTHPARALTFSQLLCLQEDALEELLLLYPRERARIRASAIWMALRRCFVKYANQMRLGRKIIHKIANEAKNIGVDIEKVFRKHDRRGRNQLSKKEFTLAMRELGYTGPLVLLDVILGRFDKDGDNSVDYVEFMNYFIHEYQNDNVTLATESSEEYQTGNYINEKRLSEVKLKQTTLSEQEFMQDLDGISEVDEGHDEMRANAFAEEEQVVVRRGPVSAAKSAKLNEDHHDKAEPGVGGGVNQKKMPKSQYRGNPMRSASIKNQSMLMHIANNQHELGGNDGTLNGHLEGLNQGNFGGSGGTINNAALNQLLDQKLNKLRKTIVQDLKLLLSTGDENSLGFWDHLDAKDDDK